MEIMVAVGVLAVTLVGLLALFVNCLFLNEASRNLTFASSHAQYVLEDVRNSAFADFTSLKTAINNGNWDWDSGEINAKGLIALKNEQIDTQASDTNPLQVTVLVTWKNNRGQDVNTSLNTKITNYQ